MAAISAGNQEAVESLLALYRRRVFRFLLGRLKNEDEAWEMTQDVLAKVCDKAGSYTGSAPLSAWIFRIARNHEIDFYRSKAYKLQALTVDLDTNRHDLPHRNPTPETKAMQAEILERVQKAIEELPERQREVIQLRLLADLTLEEIAEAVGLSLGGVKSTAHNALRSLRAKLADLERDAYVAL